MAKAVKKKSAKEASTLFHNIMAASVKGNPKPKNKNVKKEEVMKHYPKERFPGVNGETFEIRIVDTGMAIHAEINLIYTDRGKEQTAHLRTDPYPSGMSINEIGEKTKESLQAISIIKRTTGIDLFNKKK